MTTIPFHKFNAQATQFDPYNACILAELSAKAYREGHENNEQWRIRTKKEAKTWGFDPDNVYCFNHKGAQAILLSDDEKIIVAFRGSEEKMDWADNLNRRTEGAFKDRFGLKIHAGFYDYFNMIWNPYDDPKNPNLPESRGIEAILREELQRSTFQTVWFTGHSLGGAVAAFGSAACVVEDPPIIVHGVYTYGQPKVGGKLFAERFHNELGDKFFRFVNHNDIVPHVPTWAPFFFYNHFGQLKYITQDGRIVDQELTSWLKRFAISLLGGLDNLFTQENDGLASHFKDSITDHFMGKGYLPPIRKLISR
ncbi:MAG: lipase family protein [Crocosphaera sp.]|nr:lipase family protein [Crocosphaera sp.]